MPTRVTWAGSRPASGIFNNLNDCAVFIVFTQFTNVASGRLILPGGPLVGDPYLVPLGSVERIIYCYCKMSDQGMSFARNDETILFQMVTGYDQALQIIH
jgi:hypothetical protein